MGGITSFIAPIAELVTAVVPGLEEFAPVIAGLSGAAGAGEGIASGNPLGAAISGVSGALGATGLGNDIVNGVSDSVFGTGDNIAGAAGGDINAASGVAVDNPSGAVAGFNPASGASAAGDSLSGLTNGLSNPSGIGSSSNPSGVGGSPNISGTSGSNNPAGLKTSSIGGNLKSAAGAAQNIAGLVNGINAPTQSQSGGTTFGTNIVQGSSGGGQVNTWGGFADRQLYDVVDAIKARAASGQLTPQQAQQAIQQAQVGTVG